MKINKIQTGLIFVTLLLFVSWLYNYYQILFYPPYSLHAWRQADCLSFTLNYFKENLNFFKPEINGLGISGNGKTVSEFPIIYFTVAQLWKIFGQKEFIFRLINISIVFFGLFNLHRLVRSVLKDNFFSIFIPLFLFTSPVFVYYTNNFLADAPALGFALSGCYYLHRYISSSEKKAIWYALLFFLLGGLIKITSLLIFFSLSGVLIIESLLNYRYIEKVKLKTLIIGFAITIIAIGSWYMYARYYNSKNSSGFFLQSLFPIWDTTASERKLIFRNLYFTLWPSFFNRIAFASVFLLFISLLIFYRKAHRFLLLVCIFCFIRMIAYFFLWFKAFNVHDYYLTNLLIFIPLILLTFSEFLKRNYPKLFQHNILKISLSLILVFLTYQTALKNRIKYDSRKYFASDLILKQSERELWEWNHWYYKNNFKAFETVKPYLRSIGISRSDKVICLADGSINISLYLMDQKGYTKYGYAIFSDKERIDFAISQGCKYLILTSDQLNNAEELKPFLTHQIGQFQNINTYSLNNKSDGNSVNLAH
jgi:4-amino-4-deoxy-L-arabinose transferase-like glycosyltransferase